MEFVDSMGYSWNNINKDNIDDVLTRFLTPAMAEYWES